MSPASLRGPLGWLRENDINLEPDELRRDLGKALGASLAHRTSIVTVRPSIQPSSRSRCAKAATWWLWDQGVDRVLELV